MALLSKISEATSSVGILPQNDIEISNEVENLLKTQGNGGEFYIFAKELPLFVSSNWETIEKRILEFEGKVKIVTCEKPIFPNLLKRENFLYNLFDAIEVYCGLNKDIEGTETIFYNKYHVYSKDNKKFFLNSFCHEKTIKSLEYFFQQAKTNLERINVEECFK